MKWVMVILMGLLATANAKQIALTFDDVPRQSSALLTSEERTQRIIQQLKRHSVLAMFFVVSGRISQENQNQIASYEAAGHWLANHSNRHFNLRNTDLDKYIFDIERAHTRLKGYRQFRPYYRFPYLSEGNTIEKRDTVREYLKSKGYKHGYVTVDNYEWYMEALLQRAMKQGKTINWEHLKKVYVDVLIQSVEFYDDLAKTHLGRSPKHLLLLHENDLAALYIGDLIEGLKAKGWTFISPLEAFDDPIASALPKTLFNGQGRVAALAHVKGVQPKQLIHRYENEKNLEKLFEDKKVFE